MATSHNVFNNNCSHNSAIIDKRTKLVKCDDCGKKFNCTHKYGEYIDNCTIWNGYASPIYCKVCKTQI